MYVLGCEWGLQLVAMYLLLAVLISIGRFFPLFGQNWVGADPESSTGNPTTEQYEGGHFSHRTIVPANKCCQCSPKLKHKWYKAVPLCRPSNSCSQESRGLLVASDLLKMTHEWRGHLLCETHDALQYSSLVLYR